MTINNERQLDDRGLKSLHLFVLGIHEVEGGGVSLPERVEAVRAELANTPGVQVALRHGLISAGYLDRDEGRYVQRWTIKFEDLYQVVEGFPRIVAVPPGVGELRYRVMLGSCVSYRVDQDDYLARLLEK